MKQQNEQQQGRTGRLEGVILSPEQEKYLLPHFIMIVVGKPGSGKTNLVKELATSTKYYKGKYNKILVVSPSTSKMGIPVPKSDSNTAYDLSWIYQQITAVNKKQVKKMLSLLQHTQPKHRAGTVNPFHVGNSIGSDMKQGVNTPSLPPEYIHFNNNQRFFTAETLMNISGGMRSANIPMVGQRPVIDPLSTLSFAKRGADNGAPVKGAKRKAKATDGIRTAGQTKQDVYQYGAYKDVDDIEAKLVSKLTPAQLAETSYNMLIILDDVVSEIKANEFNKFQTALFFNRRHIIANGMISIIVVSQKYTLIPSRLRSNATWMIFFRLNPGDFDKVYAESTEIQQQRWQDILTNVYQINDSVFVADKAAKRYDNLGIWIEYDMFFHNFKNLAECYGKLQQDFAHLPTQQHQANQQSNQLVVPTAQVKQTVVKKKRQSSKSPLVV